MSIWYISTTGSDTTGDGSISNPYATVNKCITMCSNNDIIKVMNGTYSIPESISITKEVTITSESGINTNVIFNGMVDIFNLQSSNVSITNMTLKSIENPAAPIYIDDMSGGGMNNPSFWNNNTINNCIIYTIFWSIVAIGNFNITNNIFYAINSLYTYIIVYSTRGACNISNNTFISEGNISPYPIIFLTDTGSYYGDYVDKISSKGGILTISNNIATCSYPDVSIFILMNYFNKYQFGGDPDESYNQDTKLTLMITNNMLTFNYNSNTVLIIVTDNNSFNMFNTSEINNNTNNFTNYGALHFGKNIYPHSLITIDQNDLDRPVFNIHNNNLSSNGTL